MLKYLKKHKNIIILAAVAIISLTAAFFVGGQSSVKTDKSENYVSSNIVNESLSENEQETSSDLSSCFENSQKNSSFQNSQLKSDISEKSQISARSKNTSNVSNSASALPKVQSSQSIDNAYESRNTYENGNSQESSKNFDVSQKVESSKAQNYESSKNSGEMQVSSSPKSTSELPKKETSNSENSDTCTILISCKTILQNQDKLNTSKKSVVPSNGVILQKTRVNLKDGESAFDILKQVCMENKIQLEFSKVPLYNTVYVEGINNIYEFDCGNASGWMYKVNGKYYSYGSSEYKLKSSDEVEWLYTCNLGQDIGDDYSKKQQ